MTVCEKRIATCTWTITGHPRGHYPVTGGPTATDTGNFTHSHGGVWANTNGHIIVTLPTLRQGSQRINSLVCLCGVHVVVPIPVPVVVGGVESGVDSGLGAGDGRRDAFDSDFVAGQPPAEPACSDVGEQSV